MAHPRCNFTCPDYICRFPCLNGNLDFYSLSSHYRMRTLHSYCSGDFESSVQKFRGIIPYAYKLFVGRSDSKARDKSLAKLSREENLSNLRLQLSNDKVVTLGQLRGTSRIVILAGPGSYIEEALSLSEPFREALLERGVLVAAYATDGAVVGDKSAGTTSTSSPAGTVCSCCRLPCNRARRLFILHFEAGCTWRLQ